MKLFFSFFFITFIGFFTQSLFAYEGFCSADNKSCQYTFRPYVHIDLEGKDFILNLSVKDGKNFVEADYEREKLTFTPITFTLQASSENNDQIYYRLLLSESIHYCTVQELNNETDTLINEIKITDIKADGLAFNDKTGITKGSPFSVEGETINEHAISITFPQIPMKTRWQSCKGSFIIKAEAPV